MSFWRQLLTGRNNETIAIGRVLGLVVGLVFIFGLPSAALVTITLHQVQLETWAMLFDKLPIYLTSVVLSVAGLIGITAPSEPRE